MAAKYPPTHNLVKFNKLVMPQTSIRFCLNMAHARFSKLYMVCHRGKYYKIQSNKISQKMAQSLLETA